MSTTTERKHGVTPGMAQTYVERTVASRMPFVLPHLRPGMSLLDVGCGPGTITLGLADAVAPGRVIGVDHDDRHVEAARRLAGKRGATNVSFQIGDVYALPFEDGTFDAAIASSVFIHLSRRTEAAREVLRVLKPGGLFLTSDTCMDGIVSGPPSVAIDDAYRLFLRWHRSRGSNLKIGKRMPGILRRAGFDTVSIGTSCVAHAGSASVADHARMLGGLFEPGGPLRKAAIDRGWAGEEPLDRIAAAWQAWGRDPGAFVGMVMCEVVARKEEP